MWEEATHVCRLNAGVESQVEMAPTFSPSISISPTMSYKLQKWDGALTPMLRNHYIAKRRTSVTEPCYGTHWWFRVSWVYGEERIVEVSCAHARHHSQNIKLLLVGKLMVFKCSCITTKRVLAFGEEMAANLSWSPKIPKLSYLSSGSLFSGTCAAIMVTLRPTTSTRKNTLHQLRTQGAVILHWHTHSAKVCDFFGNII